MSELNQRARARVRPLIVTVGLISPTLSMANSQAMTPQAVAVTPVTPGVTLSTEEQTAHAVVVTNVTPGVTLEATPSPKTVTVTLVTPTVNLV